MKRRSRNRMFSWVLAAGLLGVGVGCARLPPSAVSPSLARLAVEAAPLCCLWSADGTRLDCEAVAARGVGRACAPIGTSALQSTFDIGEGAH